MLYSCMKQTCLSTASKCLSIPRCFPHAISLAQQITSEVTSPLELHLRPMRVTSFWKLTAEMPARSLHGAPCLPRVRSGVLLTLSSLFASAPPKRFEFPTRTNPCFPLLNPLPSDPPFSGAPAPPIKIGFRVGMEIVLAVGRSTPPPSHAVGYFSQPRPPHSHTPPAPSLVSSLRPGPDGPA